VLRGPARSLASGHPRRQTRFHGGVACRVIAPATCRSGLNPTPSNHTHIALNRSDCASASTQPPCYRIVFPGKVVSRILLMQGTQKYLTVCQLCHHGEMVKAARELATTFYVRCSDPEPPPTQFRPIPLGIALSTDYHALWYALTGSVPPYGLVQVKKLRSNCILRSLIVFRDARWNPWFSRVRGKG
jgi:hypothetical protein